MKKQQNATQCYVFWIMSIGIVTEADSNPRWCSNYYIMIRNNNNYQNAIELVLNYLNLHHWGPSSSFSTWHADSGTKPKLKTK
jgi:hypothetical protein